MKTLLLGVCWGSLVLAMGLNAQAQISVRSWPHYGPSKSGLAQFDMRTTGPVSPAHTLSTSAALDSFFTAFLATYRIPGMAACIVKNNKVAWEGNYGYADLSRNIPVCDSTSFFIASISKTVMATALLQLYEAGRFQLDDSVSGYLPFAVRNPYAPNVPITFRMLLTHTSSIKDNWDVMPIAPGDPSMPLGTFLHEYLTPGGQFYNASLNFYPGAPGSAWNYSNVGVALGGYIVETLSGIPFDRYCQDSIFAPLGMTHTAWFLRDMDTTLIARPYTSPSGSYVDNGLFGMPVYPAAQLRTTVHSLAQFLLANLNWGELNGNRVLDSATVRLMRTRWISGPPWEMYTGQGLIWWNEIVLGRQCWDHKGGVDGATTAMYLSDENGTGAIWFSNYSRDDIPWEVVTERLMATADTLSGSQESPKFDKGILLVNGVDFSTYGTEIASAYLDSTFSGKYPISFWDCFPNAPSGGYPRTLPVPLGHGPISLKTLGDYSTVIWIGNAYNGDGVVWNASPILSYLFLGGNVILLSKQGTVFINSQLTDYLGFTWAEIGQTLTSTTPTYPGLPILRLLGSQTFNDVFSTTLAKSDSKLLYTATGTYSGERGIGIWRNPSAGGLFRNSGGQFVHIAGRPYRWNHSDLRASMEFILKNLAGEVVSVQEGIASAIPACYSLEQNYPNPFNPNTTIKYELPKTSPVRLTVYDMLGREVALLVNETRGAGVYEVKFNASNLSSGAYLYRLQVGDFVQARKLLLLR